jgi:hypothetical protein
MTTPPLPQTRRNRTMLLVIAGIFFGTMLIAGALRFSGWHPAANQAHGELLQPPGDLRTIVPQTADGQPYRWSPSARTWRIALVPPADCGDACVKLGHQIDTVWQLMGQDADRVHVLWVGEPPAGMSRFASLRVLRATDALRDGLPHVAPKPGEDPRGIPVFLIDPNGFVIMRYPPGFDPAGLRADLAKLLKLM